MQARALSWLFLQRDELTCSRARSKSAIDVTCSRAGSNGEYSGDPSAIPEIAISLLYIKVHVCMVEGFFMPRLTTKTRYLSPGTRAEPHLMSDCRFSVRSWKKFMYTNILCRRFLTGKYFLRNRPVGKRSLHALGGNAN